MKKSKTPLKGQVGCRPLVGRHIGIRSNLGKAVSHSFIPVQFVILTETVECPCKRLHFRARSRVIFGAVVALKLAIDALKLAHIRKEALVKDDCGLEGVGTASG